MLRRATNSWREFNELRTTVYPRSPLVPNAGLVWVVTLAVHDATTPPPDARAGVAVQAVYFVFHTRLILRCRSGRGGDGSGGHGSTSAALGLRGSGSAG